MNDLEFLRAENERLKSERRSEDTQRWETLFRKLGDINSKCAACETTQEQHSAQLCELNSIVIGEKEAPGLKGYVATLRHDASIVQYILGATVTAVLLVVADKLVPFIGKLFK